MTHFPSPSLERYVARDLLACLASGEELAQHTEGTALFVDISGSSALTHALVAERGQRNGVEELARILERAYDTLISAVHRHGGSVVGFAGDSMTCWFEGAQESCRRAVACAQSMQRASSRADGLAWKVALAAGPARRMSVGDPQVQRFDVLGGRTIDRMARLELEAQPGEILADETVARGQLVASWRQLGALRYAVLLALRPDADGSVSEPGSDTEEIAAANLAPERLSPWIQRAVLERELSGSGPFLTELRPAVAVFIRFDGTGIDDDRQAHHKLDRVVRALQAAVGKFDGTLLQVTLGDKGSYAYACFGAPVAHDDDAERAAQAALEIGRALGAMAELTKLQIGLAGGDVRAGVYGGRNRGTYGALGDTPNTAARLMTLPSDAQILVTEDIGQRLDGKATLRALGLFSLKGASSAQAVFALEGWIGGAGTKAANLARMVGRRNEREQLSGKLLEARGGRLQVIAISGEPGIGKSTLVREGQREAAASGFSACAGACEASGAQTPYLPWRTVWRDMLGLGGREPTAQDIEVSLSACAPGHRAHWPLMADVLSASPFESAYTAALPADARKRELAAMLATVLRHHAGQRPLLIALEDWHWADALSRDLLESLAAGAAQLSVAIVVAHRPAPSDGDRPLVPAHLEATRIELGRLDSADERGLIEDALIAGFEDLSASDKDEVAHAVALRADGHPFYAQELIRYLRDRAANASMPARHRKDALRELPRSIHSLVLMRMDRLRESERIAMKQASVIGRVFRFDWLVSYGHGLQRPEALTRDLESLSRVGITLLDRPAPDLSYLFSHALVRDVAYESMSVELRRMLHERLAAYLEAGDAELHIDQLVYHYGLTSNVGKQCEMLVRAAAKAERLYAIDLALDYYRRLETLLPDSDERRDAALGTARMLHWLGRLDKAHAAFQSCLDAALSRADRLRERKSLAGLGRVEMVRGDAAAALRHIEASIAGLPTHGGEAPEYARGLTMMADVQVAFGSDAALACARRAARVARGCKATDLVLRARSTVAMIVGRRRSNPKAEGAVRSVYAHALSIGDKRLASIQAIRLSFLAFTQGDWEGALLHAQDSLALAEASGQQLFVLQAKVNIGISRWYLERDETQLDQLAQVAAERKRIGSVSGQLEASVLLSLACLEVGRMAQAASLLESWGAADLATARGVPMTGARLADARGLLAMMREQWDDARSFLADALGLACSVDYLWLAAGTLVALASLASRRGATLTAVKWIAAAESARLRFGVIRFDRLRARLMQECMDHGKATLSASAFEQAWNLGSQTSEREVLDEVGSLAW